MVGIFREDSIHENTVRAVKALGMVGFEAN